MCLCVCVYVWVDVCLWEREALCWLWWWEVQSGAQFFTVFVRVERQQCIWTNKMSWLKVKEPGTHCSSPHLSCLHSHSGCHTSSGLGCSCYSRSEIHEVRRSFHLFHQEQTNMKMKMASKSMNINIVLAIIFSTCNHHFLRVSLSKSDTEFKTRYVLRRLTCHKMKYLTVLPIISQQNLWQKVDKKENFLQESIQENFRILHKNN